MFVLIILALCLSSFPVLVNSVPLIHFSTDSEPRTGGCSRKVNRILESAHVVEILRILHEIVHKLRNRKLLSRNDKLTRFAGADKAFSCKTGVPWCEISCKRETLRTMSPGQVHTQTNVQPQEHRILGTQVHVECVPRKSRMGPKED